MLVLMIGRNGALDGAARELRERGLVPVVATSDQMATRMLETSNLVLALVVGAHPTVAIGETVLHRLATRAVPTLVVSDDATRDLIERHRVSAVMLPPDSSAEEIAVAAAAMIPERRRPHEHAELECGPIVIDLDHQIASVDGEPVDLPPKEFQILRELILESGRPLSSEEMLRRVWPDHAAVTPDDVHRHIYRLRGIIGDQERAEPLIVNRRGFGYMVTLPVQTRESITPSRRWNAHGLAVAALVSLRHRASRARARLATGPIGGFSLAEMANALVVAALAVATFGSIPLRAAASDGPAAPVNTSTSAPMRSSVTRSELARSNVASSFWLRPDVNAGGVQGRGGAGLRRRGIRIGLENDYAVTIGSASAGSGGTAMWVECDTSSAVYTAACDAYDRAAPAQRSIERTIRSLWGRVG